MYDCLPYDGVLFSVWWVVGAAFAGAALPPLVGYLLGRRHTTTTRGGRRG